MGLPSQSAIQLSQFEIRYNEYLHIAIRAYQERLYFSTECDGRGCSESGIADVRQRCGGEGKLCWIDMLFPPESQ